MLRKVVVAMLLTLPVCAYAQFTTRTFDFEKVDLKKLNKSELRQLIEKQQASFDSLYVLMALDSLYGLLHYATTNTMDYGALQANVELIRVDADQLNIELAEANFPKITSRNMATIGYGAALRKKRFLHEYYFSFYLENQESQDGVKIEIGGGNIINYYFGYDVLNYPRWQLYPLFNFSQQFTRITVERSSTQPNSTGSIVSMIENNNEVSLSKTSWRIGPALELDYHLKYSKSTGGILFGLRYGVNYTFSDGRYKINDERIDYDPGFELRDSYFTFLFRFYFRTQTRD